MWNVELNGVYEVWVNDTLLATTELLKINKNKLVFADFVIEETAIRALRRMS